MLRDLLLKHYRNVFRLVMGTLLWLAFGPNEEANNFMLWLLAMALVFANEIGFWHLTGRSIWEQPKDIDDEVIRNG